MSIVLSIRLANSLTSKHISRNAEASECRLTRPRGAYGAADYDIRHWFSASYVRKVLCPRECKSESNSPLGVAPDWPSKVIVVTADSLSRD
jgi:hypothetical protein